MSEEKKTQAQQQSQGDLGCSGCLGWCGFAFLAIAGLQIGGVFTGFYANGAHSANPAWLNPPSGPWIFGSLGVVFFVIFILMGAGQSGTKPTTAQQTAVQSISARKRYEEDLASALANNIVEASRISDEKAKEAEAQHKTEQTAQVEAERMTREKARAEQLAREEAQQAEARRKAQQELLEAYLAREKTAQVEAERLAREQAKSEQISREKESPVMRDAPRQSLRHLVLEYGRSIGNDPMRCRSLLLDVCGEYRREINILMTVLEEQVVSDLLSAPTSVPREIFHARLIRRMCENRGLTEEVARWGVQTWVFALGL